MVKEYTITPAIKNRWSPRAMTGDLLNEEEFMPLFEAARLAPSSSNSQPWRFIYIKRNSKHWNDIFSTLVEANQLWVKNAGLLVIVLSRTKFEKKETPSRNHSFDTGAAWENLAIEGRERKIVVHGMEGFDPEKVRKNFSIPDLYKVEILIAIGKQAPSTTLPEKLQKGEKPKERKPLEEIVSEDLFNFS